MLLTIARQRQVTPDVAVTFAVAAPGRLEEELRGSGASVHALGDVRLSRPASDRQGSVAAPRCACRRAAGRRDRSRAVVVRDLRASRAPCRCGSGPLAARSRGRPIARRAVGGPDEGRSRDLQQRVDVPDRRRAAAGRAYGRHPPTGDRLRMSTRCAGGSSGGISAPAPPMSSSSARAGSSRGRGTSISCARLAGCARSRPGNCGSRVPPSVRTSSVTSRTCGGRSRGLGLEARVTFLGERRDVPLVMRAADLFCQPNDGPEPFGVVFAEALLSGLPVVTTDTGGAPEIVSDECGRLVRAGDVDALADVLGELIDDGALRLRLGSRGPAHAAARSAPEVVLPQIAGAIEGTRARKAYFVTTDAAVERGIEEPRRERCPDLSHRRGTLARPARSGFTRRRGLRHRSVPGICGRPDG